MNGCLPGSAHLCPSRPYSIHQCILSHYTASLIFYPPFLALHYISFVILRVCFSLWTPALLFTLGKTDRCGTITLKNRWRRVRRRWGAENRRSVWLELHRSSPGLPLTAIKHHEYVWMMMFCSFSVIMWPFVWHQPLIFGVFVFNLTFTLKRKTGCLSRPTIETCSTGADK